MIVCKKCGNEFLTWIKIDNKTRNLHNRIYCLECKPFLSNVHVDEKEYLLNPTLCLTCTKPLPFKRRKEKFCNHSCAATYTNKTSEKRKKMFCLNCETYIDIRNKKSRKYCNIKCQSDYNYKNCIDEWKLRGEPDLKGYAASNYIRRYLFEKYNNKCSKCGWSEINITTNRIPLEVEHIDGNYQNNNEDNLTLLCPNCHSLTSTYKSLNKGNGRKERRKYDLN